MFFGDMMAQPAWDNALAAAESCDYFLQIGCSCEVYPTTTLPQEAKAHGATIVAIDVEPARADISLVGSASELAPRLLAAALI